MMLTRSPVVASANASPRSSFPNIGSHYAPASSPRQSSPRVQAVAKSRRQSQSPLPSAVASAAPIAGPSTSTLTTTAATTTASSISRHNHYVAVDAATQYSPMERVNYATGEPLSHTKPEGAQPHQTPPTTQSQAMAAPDDHIAAQAAPAAVTPDPTKKPVPPAVAKQQQQQRQQNAEAVAASPSKRRNSQGPGGRGASPSPAAGQNPSPSSKRARPEQSPAKELPRKYEFCLTEDMVVLIAHMLGELIETNDVLALKSGNLTRFHSRTAPGISVLDYLHRLARHATLSPPLLLSMVYYIDRLCACYPEFTINTLTVHRFLITAATVAAKGLSDAFWNNSTYAKVGGIKVNELKLLELEFLYRVDWKIVPNPDILVSYYKGLVERCPGYVLEREGAPLDDEGEDEEEDDDSDVIDDEEEDKDHDDNDGGYEEETRSQFVQSPPFKRSEEGRSPSRYR
ncbi:cyclin-domain-containing protein [Triangularia verruculosa]|uniref:Cyclin-domain-containing protein n=1 Tax=Triangularia verruculosa TaxID=2587418 RepID=A0AAN6XDV0_9PEZI|nr:cyclin-domain-containing protein [Triangularia verruculosa]